MMMRGKMRSTSNAMKTKAMIIDSIVMMLPIKGYKKAPIIRELRIRKVTNKNLKGIHHYCFAYSTINQYQVEHFERRPNLTEL